MNLNTTLDIISNINTVYNKITCGIPTYKVENKEGKYSYMYLTPCLIGQGQIFDDINFIRVYPLYCRE